MSTFIWSANLTDRKISYLAQKLKTSDAHSTQLQDQIKELTFLNQQLKQEMERKGAQISQLTQLTDDLN